MILFGDMQKLIFVFLPWGFSLKFAFSFQSFLKCVKANWLYKLLYSAAKPVEAALPLRTSGFTGTAVPNDNLIHKKQSNFVKSNVIIDRI